MAKLNTIWTQHLKHGSKEKQDFEEYIRNSSGILSRLQRIIEDQEQEIYNQEADGDDYSEGWAYAQAHRNGRKEVLRLLKKIVTLD